MSLWQIRGNLTSCSTAQPQNISPIRSRCWGIVCHHNSILSTVHCVQSFDNTAVSQSVSQSASQPASQSAINLTNQSVSQRACQSIRSRLSLVDILYSPSITQTKVHGSNLEIGQICRWTGGGGIKGQVCYLKSPDTNPTNTRDPSTKIWPSKYPNFPPFPFENISCS